VLPADRVRAATLERSIMGRDASIFEGGQAGPVCFPISTTEVQGCVDAARRHGRSSSLTWSSASVAPCPHIYGPL